MMIDIGTARRQDIVTLSKEMREVDRREALRAFPYATPQQAVEYSAEASYVLMSARTTDTDKPVALAGVARREGTQATAWMVTTDWVYDHPLPFFRMSGAVLVEMFDRAGCTTFTNIVDEENALHRRWLTWLGASWEKPRTLNGYSFLRFYLDRKTLKHVYRRR